MFSQFLFRLLHQYGFDCNNRDTSNIGVDPFEII